MDKIEEDDASGAAQDVSLPNINYVGLVERSLNAIPTGSVPLIILAFGAGCSFMVPETSEQLYGNWSGFVFPLLSRLSFSVGGALLVYCIFATTRRVVCPPPSFNSRNAETVKAAAIGYLRQHRNWYARWTAFYQATWNGLATGLILLTAASTVLSALDRMKFILMIVSGLSFVFATILTTFRIRDVWRLRDKGGLKRSSC